MMNQTHSFGVTDILPPLSIPSGDPAGETLIDRQSEVYSRVSPSGQGDPNFFVHVQLDRRPLPSTVILKRTDQVRCLQGYPASHSDVGNLPLNLYLIVISIPRPRESKLSEISGDWHSEPLEHKSNVICEWLITWYKAASLDTVPFGLFRTEQGAFSISQPGRLLRNGGFLCQKLLSRRRVVL
jgi:hypothetical protein